MLEVLFMVNQIITQLFLKLARTLKLLEQLVALVFKFGNFTFEDTAGT